jgi:hypothetical protein
MLAGPVVASGPLQAGGEGVARRRQPFPEITAQEAHAALRWLNATGKVTARQIAVALRKREALAEEIRRRLEELGGEGLRFLRSREALRRAPAKRLRRRVSAKARATWKTQGRYLGAVRRLSKSDRAKVKAIREKSGVRAAITAARKLRAV